MPFHPRGRSHSQHSRLNFLVTNRTAHSVDHIDDAHSIHVDHR